MSAYSPQQIRNVVLLGHAASGKTTLAETMLFESGKIKRRGTVEEKNTTSDFSDIEHLRGYSVSNSLLHTQWRDTKINIIDTPGYDDFIGEVLNAIQVAGTGIIVINSQRGVEVGTEIAWRKAAAHGLPILFVINQLDHEKSDYEKALHHLRTRFGNKVVPVQYPLNAGIGFNSIADVLRMIVYKFPASGGKPEKISIPENEKEKAERFHRQLVEVVAEQEEKLMETYFEKGELEEEQLTNGLKKAFASRQIFPVFCVSARLNMGSGRVMGFVRDICPSPAEEPVPALQHGKNIPCSADKPTSLFVYKTLLEPHLGDMEFVKVFSGEIKAGMDLINATNDSTERIGKLFFLNGKERTETPSIGAGDLGITVKLRYTHANDTLHEKAHSLAYLPVQLPEHKIQMAVVAKKQGEEDKIFSAFKQLHQEDLTLTVEQSRELRQTIVSGQGELHLTIAKWKLENISKVGMDYVRPRIPYRETIQKSAEGHHRHKKQSGGAGQFGEVYMLVEPWTEGMSAPKGLSVRDVQEYPLSWGGKLVFNNCIVGGAIDARFMPSILKGVMEKMEIGPLTGSYVRDVRVSVYDGMMHDVDSNDISFKLAGSKAFSKAFIEASPKILEPIYDVEVFAPEDVMGDVMSDLQTRRASIQGMDSEGDFQIIKTQVPLAELYKYSTTLRSLSQGRAYHSLKFSHYAPVPFEIQEKLIAEHRKQETVEE